MSRVSTFSLAIVGSLAVASAAQAAGGCGVGWHRGPFGGCLRNEGVAPVVVAPAGTVVAPAGTVVAPAGTVVVAPAVTCPVGYHLGPEHRRCWPN
jgi:hypothetical protein